MSEGRFKLVVLLRKDLEMSRGKAVAQGGHAVFQATETARKTHPNWFKEWVREGQRKIALGVDSEDDLLRLKSAADALGLPNALIRDSGFTELPPGTLTALGLGPAPSGLIDRVTGSLKLF